MKCPKCELEYSDSVMQYHIERCGVEPEEVEQPSDDLKALREKAEALGIKNVAKKKSETLQAEITAAEAAQ